MKIKIIVGIVLFITAVASAGLIAAGLLSRQNNRTANIPADGTSAADKALNASGQAKLVLSAAEVARHSSAKDCWMIISDNVYNVTNAMNAHPGGQAAMLPYCGRDGTKAFATKDKGDEHSSIAKNMLAEYLLGAFGREVMAASAAESGSTGPVAPAPVSGGNTTPVPSSGSVALPAANIALTSAEVAKHKSAVDCWMAISGKVYDVSAAMRPHPGGIDAILRHCGTDATQAFATQDKGSSHSSSAYAMLANYALGSLNANVSQAAVQQVQSAPLPANAGGGDDDGEEEEEEFEDD